MLCAVSPLWIAATLGIGWHHPAPPIQRQPTESVAGILDWNAPIGCPDAASVARRVVMLTREAEPPTGLHFGIRIGGRDSTGRFVMEIAGADASSARRFESADCAELGEAAAVMIALAIGMPAAEAAAAPTPAVANGDTTPSTPPSPRRRKPDDHQSAGAREPRDASAFGASEKPRSAPTVGRRHRAPRRFNAVAGSAVIFGSWRMLPGVWPGAAVGLGLRSERGSVDLRLSGTPWARAYSEADTSVGGTLTQLAGEVSACVNTPVDRVEVPVCATAAAGVVRASGIGDLERSQTAASPWFGVGLGPTLRLPLERVVLTASLDAMLMPVRARFVVDGVGPVCCQSTWAMRLAIGGELRWPRRSGRSP